MKRQHKMQNNYLESNLELISQKIDIQLLEVDQKIINTIDTYPPVVKKFIKAIVSSGGKHLRSKICLAYAHANNLDSETAVSLATGIEILHLATLIHDDLIDNGNLRRGITPIHKSIGPTSTVLFGDVLFAISAKLVSLNGTNQMTAAFAETVEIIAKAELEKSISKQQSYEINQALNLAYAKTGVLFELSAKITSLSDKSNPTQIETSTSFGKQFGIAYQLIDDLIDLGIGNHNTKKSINIDLSNQTITLPYILYFQSLNEEGKAVFLNDMENKNYSQIESKIHASTAIQDTRNEINSRIKKAKEALLHLPLDSKSYLENLISQTYSLLG